MPYGQAPYPPRIGLLAPQATGAPMGLLGGIQPNQWAGKFGNFTQNNANLLTLLGLGLLDKRQNNQVPFSQIGQSALIGANLDRERKARNQTSQFLQSKYGLSPQEADAAANNPAVLASILRPDPTGGATVYGTPIYGEDAQGNMTLGVIGKQGQYVPVDMGGVTPTPGVSNLNLGTSFQPVSNRTGQPVAPAIPIDVGGEAAAKEGGKLQGASAANLPSALNSGDRIIANIDALLTDPALDRLVGPVQGALPNISPGAQRAQSYLDQILGGTFLQAYNDLRGGGQITEAEGQAAKAAYNRLQNVRMGDADFKQALADFRNEVVRLMDIAKMRAGQTPTGEGWQDVGGGVRIRELP